MTLLAMTKDCVTISAPTGCAGIPTDALSPDSSPSRRPLGEVSRSHMPGGWAGGQGYVTGVTCHALHVLHVICIHARWVVGGGGMSYAMSCMYLTHDDVYMHARRVDGWGGRGVCWCHRDQAKVVPAGVFCICLILHQRDCKSNELGMVTALPALEKRRELERKGRAEVTCQVGIVTYQVGG
jgi:hypothetical protein